MLIAAAIAIAIAIGAFLILSFCIVFKEMEKNTIKCFHKIDKMNFDFLFKYEIKKEKSILGAKIIKIKVGEKMFLRCRIDEDFSENRHYKVTLVSNHEETNSFLRKYYWYYKVKKAFRQYKKNKKALTKRF